MKKLGFTTGDTIFVETTPEWYKTFADDNCLELEPGLPATHANIFCQNKAELAEFLDENDLLQIEKSLWISWLKKSSGQQADLTDQSIRDAILPLGWVDTKVVSIDANWSGLRFVRPQKKI